VCTEEPAGQTGWSEETSRLFLDYGRTFVPQRDHQMHIIAALLGYLDGPARILELCCGEGLLAEVLLERLPTVTVHGLDGSAEMRQRARRRLARFGDRFQCSAFDLASRSWRELEVDINAAVSTMAVHHLTGPQKEKLFADVYRMLVPGGAFVIADIVEQRTEAGTRLAAKTWDEVVRRQSLELEGHTGPFDFFRREGWNTFWFLDPDDIDKPSPLYDQLTWLERAGFVDVDVHWMLAGHAVFSGWKPQHGETGATPA
jgi:tRNA (cmo5U34)-methyltransferase